MDASADPVPPVAASRSSASGKRKRIPDALVALTGLHRMKILNKFAQVVQKQANRWAKRLDVDIFIAAMDGSAASCWTAFSENMIPMNRQKLRYAAAGIFSGGSSNGDTPASLPPTRPIGDELMKHVLGPRPGYKSLPVPKWWPADVRYDRLLQLRNEEKEHVLMRAQLVHNIYSRLVRVDNWKVGLPGPSWWPASVPLPQGPGLRSTHCRIMDSMSYEDLSIITAILSARAEAAKDNTIASARILYWVDASIAAGREGYSAAANDLCSLLGAYLSSHASPALDAVLVDLHEPAAFRLCLVDLLSLSLSSVITERMMDALIFGAFHVRSSGVTGALLPQHLRLLADESSDITSLRALYVHRPDMFYVPFSDSQAWHLGVVFVNDRHFDIVSEKAVSLDSRRVVQQSIARLWDLDVTYHKAAFAPTNVPTEQTSYCVLAGMVPIVAERLRARRWNLAMLEMLTLLPEGVLLRCSSSLRRLIETGSAVASVSVAVPSDAAAASAAAGAEAAVL